MIWKAEEMGGGRSVFYAEPEINKCHVQINNSRHETRSAPEHSTPIVLVTSCAKCGKRKEKEKQRIRRKERSTFDCLQSPKEWEKINRTYWAFKMSRRQCLDGGKKSGLE